MDLSIVVPVYNECQNLAPLHAEIQATIDSLGLSCEIIYVDDGSEDESPQVLRELHEHDARVRVITLRKNFGQTAAVACGLRNTSGAVVVTMDGDRQNDPADIPMLLDKLAEGYDLVSGWRRVRHDGFWLRRLPSLVANFVIRLTTHVRVHDYGCMLKAYRGDIARSLRLYGEMHRFIPAIAGDMGAKIAELEVNHRPRTYGVSKYGLSRVLRVILDLITVKFLSGFATRPIHVFGTLGVVVGGVGSMLLLWLASQKVFFGVELGSRPIVLLAILLVVTGVQLVTLGLLGEMLARTYHESQDKPIYVVAEDLGAGEGDEPGSASPARAALID